MTLLGEVLGNLDQRESVGDVDVADLAAGEAGLAGDGADEVLGADARGSARADEETGHQAAAALSRGLPPRGLLAASCLAGASLPGRAQGTVARRARPRGSRLPRGPRRRWPDGAASRRPWRRPSGRTHRPAIRPRPGIGPGRPPRSPRAPRPA